MKKFLANAALAVIFTLIALPGLAAEVNVDYDNSVNLDEQNYVNENDSLDYGTYTGLGNSDEVGIGDTSMTEYFKIFGGVAAIALIIIVLVTILFTVLFYLDIFHWGMTDKAVFEKAGEDKKKWFMIFFIVPLVSGLVMIIPILGWIAGFVGYIYYLVMISVYFFSIRKKVV